MAVPKRHRVDVWLPPGDLERARAMAMARGFSRKVPEHDRRQGDLAGYVRAWMRRQNQDKDRLSKLYAQLRSKGESLAASDPESPAVRWEFRVTAGDLKKLEEAASFAGFRQGGRGNVSAFMRAIVRMACRIGPPRQVHEP